MKAKLNCDVFDADDFKKAEVEKYRTVIFDGGTISEYGTHAELAGKQNDLYAKMFSEQAKCYA